MYTQWPLLNKMVLSFVSSLFPPIIQIKKAFIQGRKLRGTTLVCVFTPQAVNASIRLYLPIDKEAPRPSSLYIVRRFTPNHLLSLVRHINTLLFFAY